METKESSIIENNRLIAEFMGAKFKMNDSGETQAWVFPEQNDPSPTVNIYDEDLQYNTSWDWLMPVVEKIEKDEVFTVTIHVRRCEIYQFVPPIMEERSTKESNFKIDAVWLAVVEFIKWYNQQKSLNP